VKQAMSAIIVLIIIIIVSIYAVGSIAYHYKNKMRIMENMENIDNDAQLQADNIVNNYKSVIVDSKVFYDSANSMADTLDAYDKQYNQQLDENRAQLRNAISQRVQNNLSLDQRMVDSETNLQAMHMSTSNALDNERQIRQTETARLRNAWATQEAVNTTATQNFHNDIDQKGKALSAKNDILINRSKTYREQHLNTTHLQNRALTQHRDHMNNVDASTAADITRMYTAANKVIDSSSDLKTRVTILDHKQLSNSSSLTSLGNQIITASNAGHSGVLLTNQKVAQTQQTFHAGDSNVSAQINVLDASITRLSSNLDSFIKKANTLRDNLDTADNFGSALRSIFTIKPNESVNVTGSVNTQSSFGSIGSLGIATSTPAAFFHVVGDVQLNGPVRMNTGNLQVCTLDNKNCTRIYPPTPGKPVNCRVGEWSQWSVCDKKCGGGKQSRVRSIIEPAANGGSACPPLFEEKPCNTGPCPPKVDCQLGSWSEYSACSAPCGGGTQTRTRKIIRQPQGEGAECQHLSEARSCNTQACPGKVDCKVGDWSPWGACPACGSATISRTRSIITAPSINGAACPVLREEKACPYKVCNCEYTPWVEKPGPEGKCTKTCGGGTRTEVRQIVRQANTGGMMCDANSLERKNVSCNTNPCAIDCQFQWSDWSACSINCQQTRTARVTKPAQFGGKPCPTITTETRACRDLPCLDITNGLVGYYTGESFQGSMWLDLSGRGNHATCSGNIHNRNTINSTGLRCVYGDTSSRVSFPAIINAEYTFIHVTRYAGSNRNLIFTSDSSNTWWSGHWGGRAGIAYNRLWKTSHYNWHHTDWVLSVDQPELYRSQGVQRSVNITGHPRHPGRWGINIWGQGMSEWECSVALVYNRKLSANEIQTMENALTARYRITSNYVRSPIMGPYNQIQTTYGSGPTHGSNRHTYPGPTITIDLTREKTITGFYIVPHPQTWGKTSPVRFWVWGSNTLQAHDFHHIYAQWNDTNTLLWDNMVKAWGQQGNVDARANGGGGPLGGWGRAFRYYRISVERTNGGQNLQIAEFGLRYA
jgi:hypothetical protein